MENSDKKKKNNMKSKRGKKSNRKSKITSKNKKKMSKKEEQAKEKIRSLQQERNQNKMVKDIIWGIVYIALGAFIFIAVQFKAAGQFGNAMGEILKGLFGFVGLILPWYLIFIGLLLVFNKALHFSKKTIIAGTIMLLMFCFINSGRFIDPDNIRFSMKEFYNNGVVLSSGGAVGMPISIVLVKWFGKAGLYIFSTLIALISLLFMIKTPLSSALERFHEKREEKKFLKEKRLQAEMENEYDYKSSEKSPNISNEQLENEILDYGKDVKSKNSLFSRIKEISPDKSNNENETFKGLWEDSQNEDMTIVQDLKDTSLDTTPYEEKKISSKEIAMGAAEIGDNLGLNNGNSALTKSADKSTEYSYRKPNISLLNKPVEYNKLGINDDLKTKALLLEKTLKNFNVNAKVVRVTRGPAITRYEIQPDTGVKVSKIVNLSDDIALNLRAKSIRMEAPIPGKAAVGIEVENDKINMVTLREIVNSSEFKSAKSKIEFAVGKDIAGKPIVADLKSMPHLLISGSTGSGKSVCINSIILSILFKANPDEVKFVLIDPKVVELGNYNGIPHLLIPVVTDPSKAAAALSWAVVEMTNRYKAFAEMNVRDLTSYNKKMMEKGQGDLIMPQVVIVIDELADLMMVAPSQVEESICRLAQMARAAGMHLIVATQRPSVDVITGVIKANIPSRIAFAVSSMADSRTILDRGGAEHLVGKGDMLFNPLGIGNPIRVQGTFVSDEEVERVLAHIKSQVTKEEYSEDVIDTIENGNTSINSSKNEVDELLGDAIEFVVMQKQASVSAIQRRFRVGYNRAARIMDEMEARGIVSAQDGSRPRQVLMSEEEFHNLDNEKNSN